MIEKLFNKAPCGIFCFKDNGTLFQVNETLCLVLNYTQEDLHEKNVETIFTLPTRIFFQTHFFPLVKMHGHAEEIFISLLTSKGAHLPVLLNAQRIEWEGTPLTCCAFILVPNRKKFEDELVNARNTAERALKENTELIKTKSELQIHTEKLEEQMRLVKNQNQELKQFSHVVTHNLKEPLRKILLYTGKLQLETSSLTMEKLLKSNEQMKTVLSGLQQYVWLNEKANLFCKLNLNVIVENAVQQLQAEIPPELVHLKMDHLDCLEGDAEQLQLLFYHLLSNAVKFRKGEKANVEIHSTVLKKNRFRALENKYKYEDYVRIEVLDDGTGFDVVYKDHIFELFKKLHFTAGQGVGLALCKKIVGNHHGYIEATSEINLYTRITIFLPVIQSN